MTGDNRVAVVEASRALRESFADETADIRRSLSAHYREQRAARALRARFLAYRTKKLSAHA